MEKVKNINRVRDNNEDIANERADSNRMPDSENLFTKHYSNINNSGYNWSSVPYAIVAKRAKKTSILDEMLKKEIYKDRVRK